MNEQTNICIEILRDLYLLSRVAQIEYGEINDNEYARTTRLHIAGRSDSIIG